jgi:hypothetical protein
MRIPLAPGAVPGAHARHHSRVRSFAGMMASVPRLESRDTKSATCLDGTRTVSRSLP